jgi:hypothetical protein
MPFTHTKTAKFEEQFTDLVKLEAKPEVTKQSKVERRRKQR